MLWNDPKVIFIHIPKTGGSSIETLLHQCHTLLGRDGHHGQHATLQTAYDKYGDLSEYKIFTVARNPYDRIMSVYLMSYNRGGFTFPKSNGRKFVPFPEFYQTVGPDFIHCEDIYHYLAVNGEIPDNVRFIDFNHLKAEFELYWVVECGFVLPHELKHIHVNPSATDSLKKYLMSDPEYVNTIKTKYAKELEYLSDVYVVNK